MAGIRDFLFEIGVEELPAAAAKAAVVQAGPAAHKALAQRHLDVGAEQLQVMVSPRRIAVYIGGLAESQEDMETADRGPAAIAAFDDSGQPTKAAQGFARGKGVEVDQLQVREHKGKDFVFAVKREEGRPTIELLPDICREILAAFVFPKTMRWDDSGMRFSRPVRWLAAKFGDETVPFEAGSLESSDRSRGHRFLADPEVIINNASGYQDLMRSVKVIVDQDERRSIITSGLVEKATSLKAQYFDPAGELEEVIYLVENPGVEQGSFREEHLRLPEAVLVTAMQSHQRYFPLRDDSGDLVAAFLHVINGDPAHIDAINEGNERVLEGRLEDAEFSYGKDLDTGIDSMRDRLDDVVFHKRLGSLADKSKRLETLAGELAKQTGIEGKDRDAAVKAAQLAKADLVSIMVQEFPTLEGSMGAEYAAIDGYHADVCTAIREHYMPTASGGRVPGTLPGALLSISDKIDSLVGAFAVDELPTGSRDPYGLRRAAAGIYEICRSYELDFDLLAILLFAHRQFIDQGADVSRDGEAVSGAVFDFVNDRIQHRMVESGLPVGVFDAARAAGLTSILQLEKLAMALDRFRLEEDFDDYHTAYFRSSKIAAKAGAEFKSIAVDESLFVEDAEKSLHVAAIALKERIDVLLAEDDYPEALKAAAAIRSEVDEFFDAVMVMAEDEKVRQNRLALVSLTASILQGLGDPMKLAAAPKGQSG